MLRILTACLVASVCFAADSDPRAPDYGKLRNVAYALDGQSVAVALPDRVEIWDPALSRLMQTLPVPPMGTRMRLAWSQDSQKLALCTEERVYLWDPIGQPPKRLTHTLPRWSTSDPAFPIGVAWAPQSDRMAISTGRGIAIVGLDSPYWMPANGSPASTPFDPTEQIVQAGVHELGWSPDGTMLAGIADTTLGLWDPVSGRQIRVINLPERAGLVGRVQTRAPILAWSPRGELLATCDWMNVVQIWDAATGTLLKKLDGGNSSHAKLAWSKNGDRLLLATEQAITIWEANSWAQVSRTPNGAVVNYAAFSPDLDRGVLAGREGRLGLWQPDSGNPAADVTGTPEFALWVTDDRLVVWGSFGNVEIWDMALRRRTAEFPAAVWGRLSVAFSGTRIATAEPDGKVSVRTLGMEKSPRTLEGAKAPTYALAWNARGTMLAAMGGSSLWVWDVTQPEPIAARQFPVSGTELAWTSDHTILTAGFDGAVIEYDLAAGKPTWAFTPPKPPDWRGPLKPAKLSPDGQSFISVFGLWLRTGDGEPRRLTDRAFAGARPFWTPDGSILASVRSTTPPFQSLGFVSISTAAETVPLPAMQRMIESFWGIALSPDGQQVALLTGDGVHTFRIRRAGHD